MPGAETRTSAHLCTMPLSVTVTSTKLILSASGLQIRFNGQDIVEAKPVPRNIPNTIPQSQEWYVSLKLTGPAKEVYQDGIYELRLLDIDPSSQPTWTNDQAGAEQAAADIAVMIRSASGGGGGGGQVDTIVPGPGIDVDSTDPVNPIVSTRQKNSIEVDADELQLVGDEASPGNSEYYGTDSGGNKGFHPLPSAGTGDVVGPASSTDDHVVLFDGATGKLIKDSGYTPGGLVIPTGFGDIDLIETSPGFWPVEIKGGLDGDGTTMQSNTGSFQVNVNPKNSIEIDAAQVQLVGDAASPGNNEYYGTDGSGTKGFHAVPLGDVVGPASSTDNNIPLWDGATGKLLKDGITPGTGVATALGNNADSASGFVTQTGGDARYLLASDEIIGVLGSTQTTTSATLVDCTGLSVSVDASATYQIEGFILFQSANVNNGIGMSLNGPSSPTDIAFNIQIARTATAIVNSIAKAYNEFSVSADVPVANTTYFALVNGSLVNGANSGTLQFRFASENAGTTVRIVAGSSLRLRRIA